MPIQFRCECGQELQVQDQHAGARVRCPKCQRECTAPVRAEPITAAEPPPPPKPSPVKAAREDDREEPPKKSRLRDEEDEDDNDRPRKSRRRDEEDEDDDDRPRKRKRSGRDNDDDDDDRDRPRRVAAQSSGLATASLILGLVSLCFGALTGVPAIILGLIAFIKIRGSNGRLTGAGKAVAGVTTGLLFSIITIFAYFRVQDAKERMVDSNNLHQMGIAVHNYTAVNNGRLPGCGDPQDPFGKPALPDRKSQLSWRVHLLPYIEQDNLYVQFKLDEPWDSPTNKRLIPMMPKVYAHPKADPQWAQEGKTVYRVFTGPQCAFNPGANFPAAIPDGSSNTIMIAESADPVIWTKPDEIEYDPAQPLPKFGRYFSGGYQVAMFDGSTHMISNSVSEKTLRAAITANGNDFLGPDW
jgi:Protein of unknown function (DUF1559)/Domain of unknown function (DUF4190)